MDTSVRIVRGYGRASTEKQVLSTAQQEGVIREAFDLYRRIKPDWKDAEWGGFFADEATSRVSKFSQREIGSRLIAASRPGDVIVVSNYDRIFANVVDVCETLESLHRQHIRLLILDTDIDTTNNMGEFFFKMMALIKELEVKEIRRRITEMARHRKSKGLPHGQPPLGWKHVRGFQQGRLRSFYQPDRAYRAQARQIAEVVQSWGVGYRVAYKQCRELKIKNPRTKRRFCSFMQLYEMLRAVRLDFPLPNGSHLAAPIPADVQPIPSLTVDAEDDVS